MQLVSSSPAAQWQTLDLVRTIGAPDLVAGAVITPDFKGFGGCFNELGWRALERLDADERAGVLRELFSPDGGCGFEYCRLPVGANDFAESWYSHNETPGDFEMTTFSIARDREALIPYVVAARAAHGQDLKLFCSPWSPPTWLKHPAVHNHGTLIWEPRHRKAYAEYLARFIEAYAALGLRIDALHVQNEPASDQKFPSCVWTGAKLRDFIRDDLGPVFAARGLDAQIWLGTVERGSYNDWVLPTLSDPDAARFVSGVGFQWAGRAAVQRTRQAHPDLPIIQTECECGDGSNSWAHAHHVFDLIQHYLGNGAEAFVYWNMVLDVGGLSTWGWPQNSLFSVDPKKAVATANPEFFVMRHFARFVRCGDEVRQAHGKWAGNAICFRTAQGADVLVIQNPLDAPVKLKIAVGTGTYSAELPACSISTLADQ